MEETRSLPEIRVVLMDAAKVLKDVSDQAFHAESNIKRVVGHIYDLESSGITKTTKKKEQNIIPFPIKHYPVNQRSKTSITPSFDRPFVLEESRTHPFLIPILAKPGKPLPAAVPDYRHLLQRDGLILLSWDRHLTEKGERFTAYWVTSAGICRYYASLALPPNDFHNARPDHKSYAAEDGIEFYGQPRPYYIVHVAPELMMNLRGKADERPEHIKMLRELGVSVDFDHKFLLTREKKKFPCRRIVRQSKNGA